MSLPPHLKLNPVKERRVKRAGGCRCELCAGACPADLMEIHLLPGEGRQARPGPDLQREILILCPICHRQIHEFGIPRADQKTLVRARPARVRREIRAILGFTHGHYAPPEEIDLAAVYEEACRVSGFLVNGVG